MKRVPAEIDGRWFMVVVPDDEPELYYHRGMVIGPPDLTRLNLPVEVEDRLHHELFVRGIITKQDALKRRNEIFAALQVAFAVNTDKILECY